MASCSGASRFSLGIFLLLIVVALWVGSSAFSQTLYVDEDFDKPFFLTYFTSSCFSLYLLVPLLPSRWRQRCRCQKDEAYVTVSELEAEDDDTGLLIASGPVSAPDNRKGGGPPLVKATMRETALMAAQWGVLWALANWTFNQSLSLTSVSSVTILSSLSVFFTLLLGVLYKVESFQWSNIAAVVLSIAGVAIISVVDTEGEGEAHPHALLGDALAVLSAMLYAVYTVFLKVKLGDEERVDIAMFMGIAGAFCACATWPMLLVLDWTGVEEFEWPSQQAWGSLLLLALVGSALSDYLWLLSTLLTSPLVASIGDSLSIPLALLSDAMLGRVETFSVFYLVGSALVLGGFLLIASSHASQDKPNKRQQLDSSQEQGGDFLQSPRL